MKAWVIVLFLWDWFTTRNKMSYWMWCLSLPFFLLWLFCSVSPQSLSVNKVLEYLKLTQSFSISLQTNPPSPSTSPHITSHWPSPPPLSLMCPIFLSSLSLESSSLIHPPVSPYHRTSSPSSLHPTFLSCLSPLLSGLIRRQHHKSISGPSGAAVPLPSPAQLADRWLETPPEWPDCRQEAKFSLESGPGLHQAR